MLWVAAHLPQLGLEIFQRRHPHGVQQPMVLAQDGQVRLVDERARSAGVAIGASLATALSIAPRLIYFERDPAAEIERLRILATMAHRFTPTVSVAPPAALLLEVAGSLNLFEGLGPLLGGLHRAVQRLGHDAALAAAHTPAAALALAEAGLAAPLSDFPDRAELTQRACEALAGAPIACTEIEDRSIERLADMGLFEVGSLIRLPRHELGKRFGPGLVETLDKLTGAIPDPRASEPLRERFHSSVHLLESVSSKPILRLPMRRLAVELEAWLTARQLGARALRWFFKPLSGRSASRSTVLPVRFAQPRRRSNSLLEISGLALERIDLPAEVMSLSLVADAVEPIAEAGSTHRDLLGEALSPPQCGAPLMSKEPPGRSGGVSNCSMKALGSPQCGAPLTPKEQSASRWAVSVCSMEGPLADQAPMDFVDRVTARLTGESVRFTHGRGVRVLRQVDDHRPECATALAPAALQKITQPPLARPLESAFPQPMWLLESPRPVNPERYRILSGPERIETGWWESPNGLARSTAKPLEGAASRDYFVASDSGGARCWLFRSRTLGCENTEQWFLHGYFA